MSDLCGGVSFSQCGQVGAPKFGVFRAALCVKFWSLERGGGKGYGRDIEVEGQEGVVKGEVYGGGVGDRYLTYALCVWEGDQDVVNGGLRVHHLM